MSLSMALGLMMVASAYSSPCCIPGQVPRGVTAQEATAKAKVGYRAAPDLQQEIGLEVYETGKPTDAPVLLLHDVLGARPQCLEFGKTVRDMGRGYHVYVPVMKGKFGQSSSPVGDMLKSILLSAVPSSNPPAAPKLRALCARLSAQHGGKPVLVIANCQTGGMGIGLLSEPTVGAVIASQPAMPLLRYAGLDIGHATLKAAQAHAAALAARQHQPAILAIRYRRDWVCREPRFQRLARTFGKDLAVVELCEEKEPTGAYPHGAAKVVTPDSTQHSVLIRSEDPGARDPDAAIRPHLLKLVETFLEKHRKD